MASDLEQKRREAVARARQQQQPRPAQVSQAQRQAVERVRNAPADQPREGAIGAFADEIVDFGAEILGLPADLAQAVGSDPITPTSEELKRKAAETDIRIPIPSPLAGVNFGDAELNFGPLRSSEFSREDRSEAGRIGQVGGETFTLASSFATIPAAAARYINLTQPVVRSLVGTTAKTPVGAAVERGVDTIARTAAARPGATAAKEFTAATGAAQLGGFAESVDPGDEGTRFAMEALGSVINPTALSLKFGRGAAKNIWDTARGLVGGKGAQQDRAASIVADIVAETGEDPDEIIKVLNMAEPGAINIPPAAKTGQSKALNRLEKFVTSKRPRAANEITEANQQALADMRQMADQLTATGDPVAMRVAANVRKRVFDEQIEQALSGAREAAETTSRRLSDVPGDEAALGEETAETLSEARGVLKGVENDLWEQVPQDAEVATQPLSGALRRIDEELPEGLELELGKPLRAMAKGETTTSARAKTLRSEVLDRARTATRNGEFAAARRLYQAGDALTDMMDDLPGIEEARAFSRSFNEKWSDTFADRARTLTDQGRESELLTQAGGSGTTGATRFRELEDAAAQADEIGDTDFAAEVLNNEESFLRLAARKLVGPDGKVSRPGLKSFKARYEQVLNKFPGLKRDLADADSAAEKLKAQEKISAEDIKRFENSAIARVLETDPNEESVVRAIGDVLSRRESEKAFAELAKEAKEQGPDAVAGLASGVYGSVANRVRSLSDLSTEMNRLIPVMRREGVIDEDTANKLSRVLKRAGEVETNIQDVARQQAEDLEPPVNTLMDTFVRVLGARLGAQVGGQTAGGSIQSAGIGSKLLRDTVEKIPMSQAIDVLEEAVKDPVLLRELLSREAVKRERVGEINRHLNGALIAAGVERVDEEEQGR